MQVTVRLARRRRTPPPPIFLPRRRRRKKRTAWFGVNGIFWKPYWDKEISRIWPLKVQGKLTGVLNFQNLDFKIVWNCFGLCQICILVLENWLGGGIHGQLSYNCCGLCVCVVRGHAAERRRRRFFCHAAADFCIKRRRASLDRRLLRFLSLLGFFHSGTHLNVSDACIHDFLWV